MDVKKINIILNDFEKSNPTLYFHSERVAMICYAFAQEINLSFPEREIAYFCGMLHEIGKYYLEGCDEFDEEYDVDDICFDKDFSKLIPVLNNKRFDDEEDIIEKYGYNVNIVKLIVALADKYDNLRLDGLTHEKSCEVLRRDYKKHNNMVTFLLKTIIKNKLNHEY